MRIVVHGQQAFGKAVLEALIKRGENIVAVYCAPDKAGRPVDPLKEFAASQGFSVGQPRSWKDPKVWEELRAHNPDLCVMAYVTLLVPQQALDVPRLGTIQYHPSLLPLHRGPSSINWPIIKGAKKTGLSIFWPDEALDEGPILLQKEVAIGPDDTLGSLYFDKLFPMGVAAMCEAVDLVRQGKAPRIEQDHSKATYESWCKREHAEVVWSNPAQEIYNLIRGTNPAPGAWTTFDGKIVEIYDSALVPGQGGTAGEVLDVSDAGVLVAAADGGAILMKRVRSENNPKKIAAAEFAKAAGITRGSRLGART